MGCGGSTDKGKKDVVSEAAEVEDIDARKQKISIRIGDNCKVSDSKVQVVFVFGGPGSKKGAVIDDLATTYKFKLITADQIIYEQLPKKVKCVMELKTVKDVSDLIKEDPSHLTIKWILQCLTTKIEQSIETNFIIDLVPNMKYLLKVEEFLKPCKEELEAFEKRYPVSFALNLAVPKKNVVQQTKACTTPKKGEDALKEKGQSDEADSSRTRRRFSLYENAAKHMIEYFTETDRIVTVDVSSSVKDFIWHRVHQFFHELNFSPGRAVNTIFLFAFSPEDLNSVDLEKHGIKRIDLKSVAEEPQGSIEVVLKALANEVDNNKETDSYFAVDLSGTSINNDCVEKFNKRQLVFKGITEDYLENYLYPISYQENRNSSKKYKAVISCENELYIFPLSTGGDLCLRITRHLAHCRTV